MLAEGAATRNDGGDAHGLLLQWHGQARVREGLRCVERWRRARRVRVEGDERRVRDENFNGEKKGQQRCSTIPDRRHAC